MRIRVKAEGHHIQICLPTALIFNRVTAAIAFHSLQKYAPDQRQDLTLEQLNALFAEFRRIKKEYGNWNLVDVEGSDGKIVKFIL